MNKYIIQNDESGKQFIIGEENDNDIFEWEGEKRKVGDVVELGKDFKWGLKAYCPPLPETEEDYQMALHDAKHELPPSPKKVAIPLSKAEEVKPDCYGHKKDLFGRADMKEVAEAIGDLHYETLHDLFARLCEKFEADAIKDNKAGRDELGNELFHASEICDQLTVPLYKAWKISKPFMKS